MARDFNQNRNTNAKLVVATIDKYGASYPAQNPWRADGFNKVFVETEGANPTQKDFLEGNSSVYVYAIGSNIGSLLPYSLASFTNIKELYLFSPTMVNIGAIDNDYLTYLTNSDLKVYVPSSKLQDYITTYGGTGKHLENRFDEITDDYPLTVSGSGDLTSQELTNQLMNNYESVDRTNCTKLIIQGFTNVDSVIWGYDFSEILPNLNNNIWVNGVKFDFSVLNIVGSGTLTEVDIDNAISDIAISNRGGVTNIVIDTQFTNIEYLLRNHTSLLSSFTNLDEVEWVDNYYLMENGVWHTFLIYDDNSTTITQTQVDNLVSLETNKSAIKLIVFSQSLNDSDTNILTNAKDQLTNVEMIDTGLLTTKCLANGYSTKLDYISRLSSGSFNVQNYRLWTAGKIILKNVIDQKIIVYVGGSVLSFDELYFPNATRVQSFINYYNSMTIKLLYLPKAKVIDSLHDSTSSSAHYDKIYLGEPDCVLTNIGTSVTIDEIYIPRGSLSYYENANNWSTFAGKFVEYD